jgi:uncharacterized membrane protein YbhN (UPF0104 family)
VEGRGGRRVLRTSLQVGLSLALLALLVWLARQGNLLAAFRSIHPSALALAAGLYVAASILNSGRWQLLLRHQGIVESLRELGTLYFIGQFCSLFLPTAAGGDAVRVYEVSRGGRSPWRALLATLQERLIGLGVTMGVGFVAVLCYLSLLPSPLRWLMLAVQFGGLLAVVALLYPGPAVHLVCCLVPARLRTLVEAPWAARPRELLGRVRELPPLGPAVAAPLLVLALASFGLNALMYQVLGIEVGTGVGLAAWCLVVPLVWVVRMLPVSFNGIGVGEGAFVFLAGLLGVSSDRALALSLTILGVQTAVALVGGLLLALRVARGRRNGGTSYQLVRSRQVGNLPPSGGG